MNVHECLSDTLSFQGAMKQAVIVPEIVSFPAPKRLEPTREEYQEDKRPWPEVPLIEMVPVEYRAEAQELVNPINIKILKSWSPLGA